MTVHKSIYLGVIAFTLMLVIPYAFLIAGQILEGFTIVVVAMLVYQLERLTEAVREN